MDRPSKIRGSTDKKNRILDNFKLFHVMQCKHCQVKGFCPYSKKEDELFCPYEQDLYTEFMEGMEEEYVITTPIRILAQSVIYNIILSWRIAFMLKVRGLEEEATIYKDGEEIDIIRENILKAGLHLDYSRIIRLLKELRLTPKERTPQEKKITIKQQILQLSKELSKDEVVEDGKIKKKISCAMS